MLFNHYYVFTKCTNNIFVFLLLLPFSFAFYRSISLDVLETTNCAKIRNWIKFQARNIADTQNRRKSKEKKQTTWYCDTIWFSVVLFYFSLIHCGCKGESHFSFVSICLSPSSSLSPSPVQHFLSSESFMCSPDCLSATVQNQQQHPIYKSINSKWNTYNTVNYT